MAGMRALKASEQSGILTALDRLRDRLLFLTGLFTGYRIHELLALRVGDVWKDGAPAKAIAVARRNLKGGAGVNARRIRGRSVAAHAVLRAAIQAYIQERFPTGLIDPDEFVFLSRKGENAPISYVQAWRILKAAAAEAGSSDRVATHSMRKTFARSIYDGSGHDILLTKESIGHRSIMTTARYLEASEPEVEAAILGITGPGLHEVQGSSTSEQLELLRAG